MRSGTNFPPYEFDHKQRLSPRKEKAFVCRDRNHCLSNPTIMLFEKGIKNKKGSPQATLVMWLCRLFCCAKDTKKDTLKTYNIIFGIIFLTCAVMFQILSDMSLSFAKKRPHTGFFE